MLCSAFQFFPRPCGVLCWNDTDERKRRREESSKVSRHLRLLQRADRSTKREEEMEKEIEFSISIIVVLLSCRLCRSNKQREKRLCIWINSSSETVVAMSRECQPRRPDTTTQEVVNSTEIDIMSFGCRALTFQKLALLCFHLTPVAAVILCSCYFHVILFSRILSSG